MKSKPQGKHRSARPALLVLLALVLSAPTLSNMLAGSDSTVDAGIHLAGAVIVAWVAVAFVGYLFDGYRTASVRHALHHDEREGTPGRSGE